MDKIHEWVKKLLQKFPNTVPRAAMRYIVWYALFLILCCLLDIIMILSDWYTNGKPNLSEMRQFLLLLLSGAAVAAVGFICRWLVDADENGVPDEAEKDNRPYPPFPGKENKK